VSAALKGGPGLKEFLQRAKVLHTYRDFLRLAFQLPLDTREEVVGQIQREFRLNITAVDSYSQRAAMAEASRQRKILASYVATATTREVGSSISKFAASSGTSTPTSATAAAPGSSGVAVTHTSHSQTAAATEYEGRLVGHGWPWARPVESSDAGSTAESSEAAVPTAQQDTGTGTSRHFRELYKHRLPEL